jgi:hypothetical protein
MLFSELLNLPFAKEAFSEYITMEEAKETLLLPEHLHESFKSKCGSLCGSDIIIKRSLRKFTCCDPKCPYKMMSNLHYLFAKSFNCKYVGPALCESFYLKNRNRLELNSHLELLNIDPVLYSHSMNHSEYNHLQNGIQKIKTSHLTLADVISRIGVPTFGPNSSVLFRGINNVSELITSLETMGIDGFLYRKGIQSPLRVFYFSAFFKDILYALTALFPMVSPSSPYDMDVVATGTLYPKGKKMAREDFFILCNQIVTIDSERKIFNIKNTKKRETCEIFVVDQPSDDRSYVVAKRRENSEFLRDSTGAFVKDEEGNKITRKLIYSSTEFLDLLLSYRNQVLDQENIDKGG